MQQQLQKMEAAAQDAAQIAAAQQAMNDAVDNAAGNWQRPRQWRQRRRRTCRARRRRQSLGARAIRNGKGAGMGGPGIGAGGRAAKNPSPFASKPEMDSSADNQKGRILASNYIKDNHPIAGKSGESLKDVAESAEQEADDEVDNDRVSNQAKSTVEKYFKTMEEDAK